MAKVLLADIEITMVQMVTEILRSEGHEVVPCATHNLALEKLGAALPELVLAGVGLDRPGPSRWDIIQKARSLNPPSVVLVITPFGGIESAVEAMRKGAYDYLEKPFTVDELKISVQRALSYHSAVSENTLLRSQLGKRYRLSQIVGSSPQMLDVLKIIEHVADSDSPILIQGPSGSGKELVARAVHLNSRRQYAPFVVADCSALPAGVLEAELFGSRKGVASGPTQDKVGLFHEAEGGTILLDEIGLMSASLQTRLWRFLTTNEAEPVGGEPFPLNVRVLASSTELLEAKVRVGTFRQDLYDQLKSASIALPPLRERPDDIPLLLAHVLKDKIHRRTGQPIEISPEAIEICRAYSWPGNVRELENALERACVLSETHVLQVAHLPSAIQQFARRPGMENLAAVYQHFDSAAFCQALCPPGTPEIGAGPQQKWPAEGAERIIPLKTFLRDQELAYLQYALARAGGSKEKAAELLEISLATIYRKLSEGANVG